MAAVAHGAATSTTDGQDDFSGGAGSSGAARGAGRGAGSGEISPGPHSLAEDGAEPGQNRNLSSYAAKEIPYNRVIIGFDTFFE